MFVGTSGKPPVRTRESSGDDGLQRFDPSEGGEPVGVGLLRLGAARLRSRTDTPTKR